VIAVLVGDQNRGKGFGLDSGGGQTLERFLAAEAGIDQETGPLGGNQRRVAGA
jgi:hypothetical protein